ncbi:hypothetical protein JZO78_04455 [Enterococcus ureilyticus]|uniref:hypothetical protein n=1 Tax=Enterococcus ureilyticus TaxID=1131292 RepID=UPI001A915B9B|nr:hypothetical protein [Enterococcus ureilyticus]MBO0445587.1 hypothetical protein [Enterococcus ureilyticus]
MDHPTDGLYPIDACCFVEDVCDGDATPLVALVNGGLYENHGVKYCMNILDIELDPVADAWLRS